jgi:hypothetical protein
MALLLERLAGVGTSNKAIFLPKKDLIFEGLK